MGKATGIRHSGHANLKNNEPGAGKIKSKPAGIVSDHQNYAGLGSRGPWAAGDHASKNVPVKTKNKQAGNLH